MKIKLIAALSLISLLISSCVKDEAPNMECDIREAWIDVESGNAEDVFFSATDARSSIPGSLDNEVIEFQNVRESVSEVKGVMHFTASENASVFLIEKNGTLVPVNGSINRAFVVGESTLVAVVAEDSPEFLTASADELIEASKTDSHVRVYQIMFSYSVCDTEFHFETFGMKTGEKYYVWSDPLPNGKVRPVANWATANGGFGLARSSANWDEYPTLPEQNGYEGWGVKLETRSTGPFGQMTNKPLAAGNLFLGEFDLQTALKEPLTSTRFGVNFSKYPVKLTGYYKYFPGEQMTDGNGQNMDGTDEPAIYAILYRNHDADGKAATINGATVSNSELIVARADVESFKANTTEWQRFEIPFVFKKDVDLELLQNNGYNITIVCSSSKGGDLYQGAVGSRLYVDEFEIVTKDY